MIRPRFAPYRQNGSPGGNPDRLAAGLGGGHLQVPGATPVASAPAVFGQPGCRERRRVRGFARAIGAREGIRDPNAWIWTTAFKIASGEMARRSDDLGTTDLPDPEGADAESIIDLVLALGQISDMQRRALILRHYMGYSNIEIAGILGSTPSSIGVQPFRSTHRLRGLLSEEAGSP